MHRACHGALSRQINFPPAARSRGSVGQHMCYICWLTLTLTPPAGHATATQPPRHRAWRRRRGRTKFTSAPLVFGCRLQACLINTSDPSGCQCNASWRRQVKGAMTIWLGDNMGFSLKYPFYIVFGRQFWSDGPCLRH